MMKTAVFCISIFTVLLFACASPPLDYETTGHQPKIDPDYRDILIPPNIAPPNFVVKEDARAFKVIFSSKNQKPLRIFSRSGIVRIPMKKWKKFVKTCSGSSWTIDVYAKDQKGVWIKYETITNRVTKQPIDSHVAYRLINPAYVLWWNLGIYQRDVTSFREEAIFQNSLTKRNCMNCHSFCLNDPKRMMFHMRAQYGGTMLIQNGQVKKIDTATPYTMSAGVYPAWHPGGEHIAFSVNKIFQNFHAFRDKSTYVFDTASDLVIYDIKKNQITTSPDVSTKRMENLPAWDPNGRDLYFISAPQYVNNSGYDTLKYDLKKTSYDVSLNEWGEVKTILTAEQAGGSISFPKVSPKGRFLMFTLAEHGYFTIYTTSSDLWLYDLANDSYDKLAVNSNHVDSYHSWSSDGHWFVFASKRKDGICSRLYFSYLDEHGHASKPFLLPQKDPAFYDTYLINYNVPELINGPVNVGHWEIARQATAEPTPVVFDSTVNIDALSGASKIEKVEGVPYL